jgi:sporulation protein YlmC with PRC-barrel domain
MRIKEGDRVETYHGEKVGTVSRVVIDPRNKEITNIVVGKGFLFKEDRVLPAALDC